MRDKYFELRRHEFLERLNKIYETRKGYEWDGYTAPELRLQVKSDQVLALMELLLEEIDKLNEKIWELESDR